MDIREIIQKLKEPFAPEEHEQRELKGGGEWFFIPWQRIRDRLDEVCPQWQVDYSEPIYLGDHCVIQCTITIDGISKKAPGNAEIQLLSSTGKDMSRGTPVERATADAFKNAAEAWGVARYLDDQSEDKRQFTIRYLHSKGDARGLSTARENGWVNGNLPTAEQKEERARKERAEIEAKAYIPTKISEAQVTRFWAIARGAGYTKEGIKALLETYGLESCKDIFTNKYGELCKKAENPELAQTFNQAGTVKQPKPVKKPVSEEDEMNLALSGAPTPGHWEPS